MTVYNAFRCLGLLVTWIHGPEWWHWCDKKGTINSIWETIILEPCHKVLTFGSSNTSRANLEPVFQWILIGTLCAGMSLVARNLLSQTHQHGIVRMELVIGRHFEHFRHLGLRKNQACVLCSCCRQMILGQGTLWLQSHQPVLVKAKILLSRKCLKQRLHLFPRRQHELRGYQRLVQRLRFCL